MTDEELIAELESLGIDAESYRAVALLPLVQVAWADGSFHEAEREVVLLAAQKHRLIHGDGARLFKQWLADRPSDDDFARARAVLHALAHRETAGELDLDRAMLDELPRLCELVAKAAGGLFGLALSVSAAERKAMEEIAAALARAGEG